MCNSPNYQHFYYDLSDNMFIIDYAITPSNRISCLEAKSFLPNQCPNFINYMKLSKPVPLTQRISNTFGEPPKPTYYLYPSDHNIIKIGENSNVSIETTEHQVFGMNTVPKSEDLQFYLELGEIRVSSRNVDGIEVDLNIENKFQILLNNFGDIKILDYNKGMCINIYSEAYMEIVDNNENTIKFEFIGRWKDGNNAIMSTYEDIKNECIVNTYEDGIIQFLYNDKTERWIFFNFELLNTETEYVLYHSRYGYIKYNKLIIDQSANHRLGKKCKINQSGNRSICVYEPIISNMQVLINYNTHISSTIRESIEINYKDIHVKVDENKDVFYKDMSNNKLEINSSLLNESAFDSKSALIKTR